MRRAVTLLEVLVGAAILAGVLVPLLGLFTSTTRLVGMEAAHMTATGMADEVLMQVAHIHRRLGRLTAVPSLQHVGGRAASGELDLETYMRGFEQQKGLVLLPGHAGTARGSRVHLSPTRRGFRRYLTITAVASGPERPNRTQDVLWRARVRVEYDLVASGKDITREIQVDTYCYQHWALDEKFRPPR